MQGEMSNSDLHKFHKLWVWPGHGPSAALYVYD